MEYQVYAYGMVAASTLYILEGKFPQADMYEEIKEGIKLAVNNENKDNVEVKL